MVDWLTNVMLFNQGTLMYSKLQFNEHTRQIIIIIVCCFSMHCDTSQPVCCSCSKTSASGASVLSLECCTASSSAVLNPYNACLCSLSGSVYLGSVAVMTSADASCYLVCCFCRMSLWTCFSAHTNLFNSVPFSISEVLLCRF